MSIGPTDVLVAQCLIGAIESGASGAHIAQAADDLAARLGANRPLHTMDPVSAVLYLIALTVRAAGE